MFFVLFISLALDFDFSSSSRWRGLAVLAYNTHFLYARVFPLDPILDLDSHLSSQQVLPSEAFSSVTRAWAWLECSKMEKILGTKQPNKMVLSIWKDKLGTAILFSGGPTILSTTFWSSPSESSKISMDPPLTLRNGRMPFKTWPLVKCPEQVFEGYSWLWYS